LGDAKCETCEVILNYLDEALKENKTVQAVEALLDDICNFLPTTFKEEVYQELSFLETTFNLLS
jgi:hypothetical protein